MQGIEITHMRLGHGPWQPKPAAPGEQHFILQDIKVILIEAMDALKREHQEVEPTKWVVPEWFVPVLHQIGYSDEAIEKHFIVIRSPRDLMKPIDLGRLVHGSCSSWKPEADGPIAYGPARKGKGGKVRRW